MYANVARQRMDARYARWDAGEGSRGGKVIGHTDSGKPIYMDHNHPSHVSFNIKEHSEAANAHKEKSHAAFADMEKAEKNKNSAALSDAKKRVNIHGAAREFHEKASSFTNPLLGVVLGKGGKKQKSQAQHILHAVNNKNWGHANTLLGLLPQGQRDKVSQFVSNMKELHGG